MQYIFFGNKKGGRQSKAPSESGNCALQVTQEQSIDCLYPNTLTSGGTGHNLEMEQVQ